MPEESSNNNGLSVDEQKHKKHKQNNNKSANIPLNLTNNSQEMFNFHINNKALMEEFNNESLKKPKIIAPSSSSSFFINDILNSNANKNETNENELLAKTFLKSTAQMPVPQKNLQNNESIQFSNEEIFLQSQTNPYNLAFLNGIFKKTLEANMQPTLANMSIATMASMANNNVHQTGEMCSPMNSCIDESRDYSKDDSSSISDNDRDDGSDSGMLTKKTK